jgi:hypothetical protein
MLFRLACKSSPKLVLSPFPYPKLAPIPQHLLNVGMSAAIFVFVFPFDIHVAIMYARIIFKMDFEEREMEGRNRLT